MDQRSIDFAKTASIDLMALNNKVVNMRQVVKRAKVQLINKLCKNIRELKKKKGTEEQKLKNLQKAERLIEEIESIKKLKEDKATKYALANTSSFAEISKITLKAGPRALARLSDHPLLTKNVTQFREEHPDWRDLSAYLLVKQTGRRFKTKKQKEKTKANSSENIQASETMTKAYIQERFGEEGLKIAERRFERKRTRVKLKSQLNLEHKQESSNKGDSEESNIRPDETSSGLVEMKKETTNSNLAIHASETIDTSTNLSKDKNVNNEVIDKKQIQNDDSSYAMEKCKNSEKNDKDGSESSDNDYDGDENNVNDDGCVECVDNESVEDSEKDSDEPVVKTQSKDNISETIVTKSLSKANEPKPEINVPRKTKQSESVVKEIDLDEMTGIDIDSSDSEGVNSDSSDETESSDNEGEGSDRSFNSDYSSEADVQSTTKSVPSKRVRKSKKVDKTKIPDTILQNEPSRSHFEGSGDTFFEGNHENVVAIDDQMKHDHPYESFAFERNLSNFDESSKKKFSSMFCNTGIEDEKIFFRPRRGRGHAGNRGGRGEFTFGQNRGYKTESHGEWKKQRHDKGERGRHMKDRRDFGTDRGPSFTTDKSTKKGFGKGSDNSQSFGYDKGTKNVSEPKEKLHPSWEASRKRKAEQSGLVAFKGSKITFDDDD